MFTVVYERGNLRKEKGKIGEREPSRENVTARALTRANERERKRERRRERKRKRKRKRKRNQKKIEKRIYIHKHTQTPTYIQPPRSTSQRIQE